MNVYSQLLRAQLEVKASDHVGTIPALIWWNTAAGQIKFGDGTNVVNILANDQKAIFGTDGTASNNIRLNRSKATTLQLVPGDDATAEGSDAATLAEWDAIQANFTDGTRPAVGNAGRIIWNTTAGRFEGDTGAAWDPIGSGGGGLKIESAEHECESRHAGVRGSGFDNGICSAFEVPGADIEGFLLEDLASASSAPIIAWSPKFLDPDGTMGKNSLFTAEWAAVTGTSVANVDTEGTTKKLGASAISWDKSSGTVNSYIQHDLGAGLGIGVSGHQLVMAMVNLPSITDLVSVSLRLSAGADDPGVYEQYDATVEHDSTSLVVGWNLLSWDLSGSSTGTGGGWEPNEVLRTFAIGVVTGSTSTVYTNIVMDSLVFVIDDGNVVRPTYEQYGQLGNEYDVVDTSNREAIVLDSASPRVVGNVTLDAVTVSGYSGGTASVVMRSTVRIDGDNQTRFNATSNILGATLDSGDSDLLQTLRSKKNLKETLSAATIDSSATFDTELFFDVSDGAATATTIEVQAPVDVSANLLNGDVCHIVSVFDNDGDFDYKVSANIFTLTAGSSWATGVLTLTGSAPDVSNVSTGDMIVKAAQIDAFLSMVTGATTDESFSSLTRSEVIISGTGLLYPKADAIFGHYLKLNPSNATTTQASTNVKPGAPGVDLTITGAVNVERSFLNGQLGAGVYSATDYFSIPSADAGDLDPDSAAAGGISGSVWVYPTGTPTGNDVLLTRTVASTRAQGWSILHLATGAVSLEVNAAQVATSAVLTLNEWSHVSWTVTDAGSQSIWLNGVRTDGGTAAVGITTQVFYVGRWQTAGDQAVLAYMADLVLWSGNLGTHELSNSDVNAMYASGRHRVLGLKAGFKYRYVSQSQTGDKLSNKAHIVRATSAVEPFLTSFISVETS